MQGLESRLHLRHTSIKHVVEEQETSSVHIVQFPHVSRIRTHLRLPRISNFTYASFASNLITAVSLYLLRSSLCCDFTFALYIFCVRQLCSIVTKHPVQPRSLSSFTSVVGSHIISERIATLFLIAMPSSTPLHSSFASAAAGNNDPSARRSSRTDPTGLSDW